MSQRVSDILTVDRTACEVEVSSKKRALETVSELIASAAPGLASGAVFDCLLARERLGSTGLGHGVGLPHGRLKQLDRPLGAFVRLVAGVDYDAADREPVDLLFGLLLPDSAAEANLELLASLAERFDDAGLRERLRSTRDCHALFELVTRERDGGG
jgi:PTS system nitrogen regulatory IIA component